MLSHTDCRVSSNSLSLISASLKIKRYYWRGRNLFLPATVIYCIYIIYIYFYILRRVILYGLRFGVIVCRKVITVRRAVCVCTRDALRCFIEIISAAFAALHKIPLVDQLQELVAVCG